MTHVNVINKSKNLCIRSLTNIFFMFRAFLFLLALVELLWPGMTLETGRISLVFRGGDYWNMREWTGNCIEGVMRGLQLGSKIINPHKIHLWKEFLSFEIFLSQVSPPSLPKTHKNLSLISIDSSRDEIKRE